MEIRSTLRSAARVVGLTFASGIACGMIMSGCTHDQASDSSSPEDHYRSQSAMSTWPAPSNR
jgi:hypothetical protein